MWDRKTIIWSTILSIVAIGQVVGAIVFYNHLDNDMLTNVGWIVMFVSGLFGWLPIFTFRKRGGVEKGQSYTQTTDLVDTGIYGIVRHPQYLSLILISTALMLIAPHWSVILLGGLACIMYYAITFQEEASNLEKFGDAYHDYTSRVPRLNPIIGIVRKLKEPRDE